MNFKKVLVVVVLAGYIEACDTFRIRRLYPSHLAYADLQLYRSATYGDLIRALSQHMGVAVERIDLLVPDLATMPLASIKQRWGPVTITSKKFKIDAVVSGAQRNFWQRNGIEIGETSFKS